MFRVYFKVRVFHHASVQQPITDLNEKKSQMRSQFCSQFNQQFESTVIILLNYGNKVKLYRKPLGNSETK